MKGAGRESGSEPRSRGARRRSTGRLAAVQALYQMDITACSSEPVLDEFIRHRMTEDLNGVVLAEADRGLFVDVVRGVGEHREQIDNTIAGALSESWTLDRLETILLAVLRAGVFELLHRPDVPARVAVSEYVGIADAFYGGKEPALVNGVLDRIARVLRPEEMDRPSDERAPPPQ